MNILFSFRDTYFTIIRVQLSFIRVQLVIYKNYSRILSQTPQFFPWGRTKTTFFTQWQRSFEMLVITGITYWIFFW